MRCTNNEEIFSEIPVIVGGHYQYNDIIHKHFNNPVKWIRVNDDNIFLNSIPVYENIDFAIYNNKITDKIHPEKHVNAISIDPIIADYNLPTI